MKIAIITSRYPDINKPYNHMFVHMRSLEFIKNNIETTVFIPSIEDKNYTFEGVNVFKSQSVNIIKSLKNYDVIYLHLLNLYPYTKKDGWLIYKYILNSNLPFAMYIHGNEVQKYKRRFYNYDFTIKESLKWFKKDILVIPKIKEFITKTKDRKNAMYIFPSNWMKKETEDNLNLNFNNFKIIPNGIDTKLFSFHNIIANKTKIVTVRSLSEKVYDIKFTIDVLHCLPNEFTLDIYGKGILMNQYNAYIKKLNLQHRIKIIPTFIDRNKLNKLFSNYGIFISTTKTDSQGVTMLEAMASGLLTVSTNNSAKPEFIKDQITGILGKTPKEIANKIITSTNNDALFKTITKNGRNSMATIDIKKTVDQELMILKQLER